MHACRLAVIRTDKQTDRQTDRDEARDRRIRKRAVSKASQAQYSAQTAVGPKLQAPGPLPDDGCVNGVNCKSFPLKSAAYWKGALFESGRHGDRPHPLSRPSQTSDLKTGPLMAIPYQAPGVLEVSEGTG